MEHYNPFDDINDRLYFDAYSSYSTAALKKKYQQLYKALGDNEKATQKAEKQNAPEETFDDLRIQGQSLASKFFVIEEILHQRAFWRA